MQTDRLDEQILTRCEVASMLRVHPATVSRLSQAGDLKSYQIGTRRLFKRSDVLVFFEKQIAVENAVEGN